MRRWVMGLAAVIMTLNLGMPSVTKAGWFHCHPVVVRCVSAGPCLVPQMVTEKRIIEEIVCRPVVKQRTIQVCRRVPETHMQTRLCTVMVPQTEMRTICYTACKPVWREVEQTVVVPVPEVQVRQGVRQVCRRVPVQTTRVVCRDEGCWEDRVDRCGRCCRVWVPNIVQEKIPCTVYKTEIVSEPYEYRCRVYRQELKKRMIRVCDYEYEERTKEVPCTRYVPKTVERQFPVCTFKVVTEEKQVNYTEWIQEKVQREVEVTTCRWVPAGK